MDEVERRQFAQHVALQVQYFLAGRDKGRMLTSEDMEQAMRNTDAFMLWFFGPIQPRVIVDPAVPPDEVQFRDASGKLVGRITNIGPSRP